MEDSPSARLRPVGTTMNRSPQAYTTLASEDIELKSEYRPSINRQNYPPVYESLPEPAQPRTQSFWKKTWIDVKSFPWARFFFHMILFLMVLGLIALMVFMIVASSVFTFDNGDFCKPDGSFDFSFHPYTPWKRNGIFAINMKFGQYEFGRAKLIDVSWDVGIGRGSQAFLGFMSYRIFTRALTRTMEASSVSHDTFRAVTLQNDTATGAAILIREFFKTTGGRARAAMLWIILAGSFVLLVPTWLSAMTGYTADIQSFVLDKEDNLVSASKFRPVVYVIHDGARLGDDRTNDTYLPVPWSLWGSRLGNGLYSFSCGAYVAAFNQTEDGFIEFGTPTTTPSSYLTYNADQFDRGIDCKWMWSISKYVSDYGFLRTSTDLNTTLHEPSDISNVTTRRFFNPPLNISAHFMLPLTYDAEVASNWSACPFGRSWQNPIDQQFTFNISNPLLWDAGSDTSYIGVEAFNRNGSCQQSGDVRYQWGFSFFLLYTFVAALIVWTIGMLALSTDSWLHSRLDVSQRYMGMERALLDLSESILSKVDGDDIKLYGNHQIRVLVAPNMLTLSDLRVDPHVVTRWTEYKRWWRHEFTFKRWISDEKWWLCAMLFFDLMSVLSWTTQVYKVWLNVVAPLPGFGVFLVLMLGRGVRGRWVVFAFWFIIFFVVQCCWLSSGFV